MYVHCIYAAQVQLATTMPHSCISLTTQATITPLLHTPQPTTHHVHCRESEQGSSLLFSQIDNVGRLTKLLQELHNENKLLQHCSILKDCKKQ